MLQVRKPGALLREVQDLRSTSDSARCLERSQRHLLHAPHAQRQLVSPAAQHAGGMHLRCARGRGRSQPRRPARRFEARACNQVC
jgi:hypothetical protein